MTQYGKHCFKPVGMLFSAHMLTVIKSPMKCVLLLAAVYSLIIHQWHKDKGTSLAKINQHQKLEVKKDREMESPAQFTTAAQFISLSSNLKGE